MKINLYNEESEKVLIAQMIIDESIIDDVILQAPIEAFTNSNYRKCYKLILDLVSRKEKVDSISFITECKTKNIVNFDVIEDITNSTYSAANWQYYAKNVMNCYKARQLQKILGENKELITNDNSDELIGKITKEIDSITELTNDVIVYDQKQLMIEYVPKVEDMIVHPEKHKGIQTGLSEFDRVTGGIFPEWYIISARTNMGKTFLVQQWALNFAMQKKKVAFIELEMPVDNITLRNIAILSGLRINDIKFGGIRTDKQKCARVQSAMEQLALEPIGTHYNVVIPLNKRISTICNYIKKAVRKNGVEVVIIDHVGLIKSDEKFSSNWEAQSDISHKIQDLQRELKIPIITLAQRARTAENGNKGDISTVRGSGSYEEDADTVITIEHARQTAKEQQDKIGKEAEIIDCELFISKSRNGNCGIAKCKFYPAKGRFYDMGEK